MRANEPAVAGRSRPDLPLRSWPERLLLMLSVEKIAQHAVVTWAFVVDLGDLRDDVAVDYRWLAVSGAATGLLFVVAFGALITRRRWSFALLSGLSAVDIVGEFIAQGTLLITITVSFVVAWAILILSRTAQHQHRRRRQRSPVDAVQP